jgi:hypothetical protein
LVPEEEALSDEEALEDNPDLRRAVFGRQVEMFLESDIGVYLTQCCQAERDEALEKLKIVGASDVAAILALQARVWRAESVMGWLGDALRAGKQAKEAFQEAP